MCGCSGLPNNESSIKRIVFVPNILIFHNSWILDLPPSYMFWEYTINFQLPFLNGIKFEYLSRTQAFQSIQQFFDWYTAWLFLEQLTKSVVHLKHRGYRASYLTIVQSNGNLKF